MIVIENSEFRAYIFIENSLKELGWDIRNPNVHSTGQVYTQGEVRKNEILKKYLDLKTPEHIVKLENGLWWVIEAKVGHEKLKLAIEEAKEYAKLLNKEEDSCILISGVAGNNQDSYLVETYYKYSNEWVRVTINNFQTTGFLSPATIKKIIQTKTPFIKEEVISDELFLIKANRINKILHSGAINKRNRAKVLASLLLALAQDEDLKMNTSPTVLIGDINNRVKEKLRQHNKENFAQEIQLHLPTSEDNHEKHKQALIDTIQELKSLNIRSAINSGRDILGNFYETFLKYANDAKEIGIVLTPRHITEFAANCLNIQHNDYVFDPACGTGGFLVAAFDYVKINNSEEQISEFKQSHIFGIEQDPEIVGLALVNMIFRGDGNSNLYEGNTFSNTFKEINGIKKKIEKIDVNESGKQSQNFITKVLMNPPFALEHDKGHRFVDHALSQMVPGGLLFAILPTSAITSASDGIGEITWRKELLKRHSVEAIIKLSNELFQPVASVGTYAIIIRAHKPHSEKKNVLFAIMDDGFMMSKKRRIQATNLPSNIELIKKNIKKFLLDPNKSIEKREKVIGISKLDFTDDETCDLAPEVHLQVSNKFGNSVETMTNLAQALIHMQTRHTSHPTPPSKNIEIFGIEDFFELPIKRGECGPLNKLKSGNTPVITTTELNNGIAGYYDISKDQIHSNAITISANGASGCAFFHPYHFAANADIIICKLKKEYESNYCFKIFLCGVIRDNAWKFNYSRKCCQQKISKDIKLAIPMERGEIDWVFIENSIKNSPVFPIFKNLLHSSCRNFELMT